MSFNNVIEKFSEGQICKCIFGDYKMENGNLLFYNKIKDKWTKSNLSLNDAFSVKWE